MSAFPHPSELTIETLVAQLMVIRTTGFLFDHQLQYPQWEADLARLQGLIERGVGGVILLGGSAAEVALKNQQMQAWSEILLLICADIEEGVGQRFGGATWFPPPMALAGMAKTDLSGAIALAQAMGKTTAQEALAIGINWLLTPTVDVNNNPDNPVINVRAFGETPVIVSALTSAYIRGAKAEGALTTAKHFPGHGDTATDSHWNLPVIPHDRPRLDQVELAPFRTAIALGVDAVMSGHLIVPALDQEPTTFSSKVMTDLLRGELGFRGLVVTDALVMGAIAERYGNAEAAIRSIEAGNDLVMMPLEAEGAIEAIVAAVASGRLSRERLEQSVARLWQAKAKIAIGNIPVNAAALQTHLGKTEALGAVDGILRGSIVVQGKVQLDRPWHNVILTDNLLAAPFIHRMAPAIAIPQGMGARTTIVDCHQGLGLLPTGWVDQDVVLQVFLRGNPLRGIEGAMAQAKRWIQWLGDSGQLKAVVVYGSPYVLEQLQAGARRDLAWVFCYGQMDRGQAMALAVLFDQKNGSATDKEGMFA
jgi:beta-glucosidase